MPQTGSLGSEADDGADILVEEHERLQNQIRVIQNEREKDAEETKYEIFNYNKEIGMLATENDELNLLYGLSKSDQNKKRDTKTIEVLKEIVAEQDYLNEQIQDEKAYEKQLDVEALKYERLIKEKQIERGLQIKDDKEYGDLRSQVDRKISGMEANLHHILTYNESLRGQIEKLRGVRNMHMKLQRKLQDTLGQLNTAKSKTTQQATLVYEHRAEIKARCQALFDKNEKEKAAFELEIRDLRRVVDHNTQLDHFMKTKSDERVKWKSETEERRKLHGSTGSLARMQKQQKISGFEVSMSSIQQITGENDVDQVIHQYNLKEDENFTLFNYVAEVNDQIEDLEQDMKRVNLAAGKCKKEQEMTEQKTHKKMHKLEKKMNSDRRVADVCEQRTAHIHKLLDQMKSQIKNLAIKLDCDLTSIVNMMASDGQEVTERNLMLYLAVLEQRVDELSSIKHFTKSKTGDADATDEGKSVTTFNLSNSSRSTASVIVLPSLSDDGDDSDEDASDTPSVRPLTQTELLARVNGELLHLSSSRERLAQATHKANHCNTVTVGNNGRRVGGKK